MCSFCGKSHAEVRKLLSGPGVYLCDNCVILCKNLLDVELAAQARKLKMGDYILDLSCDGPTDTFRFGVVVCPTENGKLVRAWWGDTWEAAEMYRGMRGVSVLVACKHLVHASRLHCILVP